MNTQDKATPRPWKIGSSNEVFPDGEGGESFSEWLNIVGQDEKVICELPGHSQFARNSESSKIEDANAALIVAAVNQFDALTKVAEAAKKVRMGASMSMSEYHATLEECDAALSALAAIKEGGSK